MKGIIFILATMLISTALFIAQCVTFLQDHSLWEMMTSPIQFWTGKFAVAGMIIALLANITIVAAVRKAAK